MSDNSDVLNKVLDELRNIHNKLNREQAVPSEFYATWNNDGQDCLDCSFYASGLEMNLKINPEQVKQIVSAYCDEYNLELIEKQDRSNGDVPL